MNQRLYCNVYITESYECENARVKKKLTVFCEDLNQKCMSSGKSGVTIFKSSHICCSSNRKQNDQLPRIMIQAMVILSVFMQVDRNKPNREAV